MKVCKVVDIFECHEKDSMNKSENKKSMFSTLFDGEIFLKVKHPLEEKLNIGDELLLVVHNSDMIFYRQIGIKLEIANLYSEGF